jgi:hypothetical protein
LSSRFIERECIVSPFNVLVHKIKFIKECLKADQIMAVATEEAGDHARWAPEDWFVDEEATGGSLRSR